MLAHGREERWFFKFNTPQPSENVPSARLELGLALSRNECGEYLYTWLKEKEGVVRGLVSGGKNKGVCLQRK